MGQKLKNLDPLPASNDGNFWGEAEIHTNLVPHVETSEAGHYFVRKTGRSAQCMFCDWGFDLEVGDRIKDGHLYDRSGKMVI